MSKHHSIGHGHGHSHAHHHGVHHDGSGHAVKAGGEKHVSHISHDSNDKHSLNGQVADLLTKRSQGGISKHLDKSHGEAKIVGSGDSQALEFTADKVLARDHKSKFVDITDLPTSHNTMKSTTKEVNGKFVDVPHLTTAQLASAEMGKAGGGGGAEQKPFERTAATTTVPNDASAPQGDAAKTTPALPALDGKQSVADMIKNGTFGDRTAEGSDKVNPQAALKPGEVPKIKVQYEDQTKDPANPQEKPNFIVNKDGSVQVVSDPEKNPSKEIIVQVQRDAKQTGDATPEQQAKLDQLVPYLAQRVAENPEYQKLSQGKVSVEDPQNLVKDDVENKIANNINKSAVPDVSKPPQPEVPQDTGDVSGRMNRVHGSGGGRESFSPGAGGTVPQRDVPVARDNTPPVQAVEDTVAALSGVDKQHPYESIKRRSDGSYGVGRYAMSHGAMCGWLAGLLGIDLGDPPDYSKLEKYLKEHPEAMKGLQQQMQQMAKDHKVPQDFADKFNDPKFAQGFVNFIGKLNGQNGEITPQELKQFMPKELQETIAQNRVETYGKQMGIDTNKDLKDGDAGKLALAMFLGRAPNEGDLASPQNQKYMQTAENVYKLALAGQFGSDRVDVSEVGGKLVAAAAGNVNQALWAKTQWANACQGGNLGCAASVSRVLQETGVLRPGEGSAGVEGLAGVLANKGFQRVHITDKSQFKPGDVVYGLSGGGRHGHIGIIGEVQNGQVWVYDNSSASGTWQHRTLERGGSFVPGGRFGNNLYVMRAKAA